MRISESCVVNLRSWLRAQSIKYKLDMRVDERPDSDGVRVTVFTHASGPGNGNQWAGSLRANFVDIPYWLLVQDDVRTICENVEEAIRSLLCQLTPPRDGGAFTQDDAIKLSGVRDVSKANRRVRRG